jgi:hypothetical protein
MFLTKRHEQHTLKLFAHQQNITFQIAKNEEQQNKTIHKKAIFDKLDQKLEKDSTILVVN